MWSVINDFLVNVDNFVWGVPLMVLIMAGGLLLTVRLGLLQIRKLPLALKWMIQNEEEAEGEISSFAALCTALSDRRCCNRCLRRRSGRSVLDGRSRFSRNGYQIFRRTFSCQIPCRCS